MDFYVYNTIHKQLGDADETKSVSPFYDGTDSGANMGGGGGRGDTLSLNDENYAVVNDTEDALWRYCRCGL